MRWWRESCLGITAGRRAVIHDHVIREKTPSSPSLANASVELMNYVQIKTNLPEISGRRPSWLGHGTCHFFTCSRYIRSLDSRLCCERVDLQKGPLAGGQGLEADIEILNKFQLHRIIVITTAPAHQNYSAMIQPVPGKSMQHRLCTTAYGIAKPQLDLQPMRELWLHRAKR